jgi:hypothetical protein
MCELAELHRVYCWPFPLFHLPGHHISPPCGGPTPRLPVRGRYSRTFSPVGARWVNGSTLYVCRPLPINFSISEGYIGYVGSAADSLISDAITQRNSQHSPLLALWVTLSLLMRPIVSDHVSEPYVPTGKHTLLKDSRLKTLRNKCRNY